MNGETRIECARRGALLLLIGFFIVSLCFAARCEAAPVTAFVGEVASYGDYALQSGFFETFRDRLEESLSASGKFRVVMRRPTAEDAARLIAAAQEQLSTLDPSGAQYGAIVNAATALQQLIDSGASQNEVTAAMTALTQAMIGIF
jgi:hypothetical protein